MAFSRRLCVAVTCALALVLAPAASAAIKVRPRIGGALGIIPAINGQFTPDVATGALTPVIYHGGSVMTGGVTVHTIFWTGGTNAFQGQPTGATADYEGMIDRFFTDVAHDSGATANVFSVLRQYGQGTTAANKTPGDYSIAYSASSDVVVDNDAYPSKADQCASPVNIAVCVTDGEIQAEVDKIVQNVPGTPRGLSNLWYVFLPPGVDECITASACGSNAFVAYHSASNVGHGVTIYAVGIDPIIEGRVPPGADPQGYPDVVHDRRGRPRDRGSNDRSAVRRLDGPQRPGGGRQMRDWPAERHAARLCSQRLAVQPGDQWRRMAHPGDVLERRQRRTVRAEHDPDEQRAAAAPSQPHAVQLDGER
jgi:hypothetical protein